jgi:HD-like signal output (HDOD) protein
MDRMIIDRERLDKIESLPTLPTVATQLLEMLGRSEVSLNEISRLMEQDPSITAQVLKVANSALYGLSRRTSTVQQALVVLGVTEAANIILSLSLFRTFAYFKEADFDLKEFWRHCGIVGYLAKFLTRRFRLESSGEEYTAGLMHDLGKIIFAQYFHEDFLEVVEYLQEHSMPSHEAEYRILGVTHNEAGYWLGLRWGFPARIMEAIRWHHAPENATEFPKIAAVTALADLYALRCNPMAYEANWKPDTRDSKAWEILGLQLTGDEFVQLEEEILKEIEKAVEFLSVVF